jgi:hypothetical protein
MNGFSTHCLKAKRAVIPALHEEEKNSSHLILNVNCLCAVSKK